jgi:hypothetical protein
MVRLAQPLLTRANGATRARPPRLAPSPSRLAKKISPSAPRSVPIPAARRPGDRPQASQARRRVGRQEGCRRRRGEGQGREELQGDLHPRGEVREGVPRSGEHPSRPAFPRPPPLARKTPMFPRAPGPAAATALAPPAPRTTRDGRRRSYLPPGSRARRGPPRVAPSRGTRRRVLGSAAASRTLGLSLRLLPRREGRLPKTRPGLSTVRRSSVSLPRPPADHIPSSPIVRFRHRRRLTSSGSSARLAPRVAFTSSPRRSSCS